jgi:curved DNA-binding protein CbpA/CheY-like chemotaxis protein
MGGYILIVESDPVLQRRIGDTLKEAHYELASEAEGAWARRSVAVRTPDAIVVDTVLSDGDGFRLAEDLRREPETRDTPIFFVASRFRGASHRSEARRRFAPAEYLPVPIDVNSLLAMILQAVPPARNGVPGEIHTAPTQPIVEPPTWADFRTPTSVAMETPLPVAVQTPLPVALKATPPPALPPFPLALETPPPELELSPEDLETPPPVAMETPPPPVVAPPSTVTTTTVSTATTRVAPMPAPPPGISESLRDPVQQRESHDVERTASSLVAETTDFTDNLKNIPFPRLLQRLYVRRATGSLLLLHGGTKKIVSFVEGYPVAVRSNLLSECLGQILLSQNMISGQALVESVKRMQKEKRRQGEILVEMGALSPYNLTRALVEQSEAKLFEIFTWRDGQFMFKQGEGAPKEALRLERSPAALVLEGIRRHYDAARQVAVLDGFAKRFVALNPDPLLRMQEMTSEPTEMAFIRGITGAERIEDLLSGAEISRDKAVLLLVALSEAGVIMPGEAPLMTPEPEATRLAIQRHDLRAGGPTDADVSTEELIGDLEDDPAVLSIEPVPQAPTSDDGDLPSGPLTGVATPLGSGPLSMVAQTVRTQDYFCALGVERSATGEEIDRAYESLARTFHADAYRQSPDEDRRLAQEIFDRLTEAHRVLRDPAQRRAYTEGIDLAGGDTQGGAFATQPSDASASTPTKGTGGGGTTAGNAAANALFDSGMDHLKARRHHEAVEAFRQAARLVPGEANFRATLGWSLFREAPADARAGRAALAELRRAIQIDGQNLRALHYLANYFAETGQPDLAVEELQRILQIDPDSTEAADQLRRLQDDRA